MNTILIDVLFYSVVIAFIIFMTGILFIYNNYKYNKIIISIFCVISAIIVIYFDNMFRGYPAKASPGIYRLQGWEVDEINNEIFLMVIPNNNIPKNFVIPFNLKDALLLQEASENSGTYKEMSVNITSKDNSNDLKYDFIFVKRFEASNIESVENEQIEESNTDDLNKEIEALENYPKPNK